MAVFSIDANGNDVGEYIADTEALALDAYARDAGYDDWADVVAQFGSEGVTAVQIDADALCAAVQSTSGHLVFEDAYGNGVALVDQVSYATYQELAQLIDKNVWDFKA